MAEKRGRRVAEGRVLKANNEKTRVVAISQNVQHSLYGRIMRRTAKCVAHDEKNESQVGDVVRIEECRPMSRTKRWRLLEIIGREVIVTAATDEADIQ
jgi:small subunit ribosomal protein S17